MRKLRLTVTRLAGLMSGFLVKLSIHSGFVMPPTLLNSFIFKAIGH